MPSHFFDSHCHLHYDYTPKTTEQVVQDAAHAGVQTLVTVATDVASLEPVKSIAERFENVFFTTGIHPHDVSTSGDFALVLSQMQTLAQHPKCLAIGEIGLDTYYEHSDLNIQLERLAQQINLANRMHKPCVFHVRGKADSVDLDPTEEKMLVLLKETKFPSIIHCFTGSNAFGNACLKMGHYISLSGIITFKKSDRLRTFAQTIPKNQLLIETDAPYLAPVPFRGKQCEPFMVKSTAELLANLFNIPLETLAQLTTHNARNAFQMQTFTV
jgi:TatD DNase family protein